MNCVNFYKFDHVFEIQVNFWTNTKMYGPNINLTCKDRIFRVQRYDRFFSFLNFFFLLLAINFLAPLRLPFLGLTTMLVYTKIFTAAWNIWAEVETESVYQCYSTRTLPSDLFSHLSAAFLRPLSDKIVFGSFENLLGVFANVLRRIDEGCSDIFIYLRYLVQWQSVVLMFQQFVKHIFKIF